MKIIAYYLLHYGKEWLFHSMRSVRPYVDEIRVFYSPQPSRGQTPASIPCPDSRDELHSIAEQFDAIWDERLYPLPGQHTIHAHNTCRDAGADIQLKVDADEIWLPDQLEWVLEYVQDQAPRNWLVNMLHFWTSLNWVCRDNMWPERIIMDRTITPPRQLGMGYIDPNKCQPLHMSYVQSSEITHYRFLIHGQKLELRPGWFEKWLGWKPGMTDVHPTDGGDTWTPEPFDKNLIKSVVGDHPYFHLERVM